MSLDTGQIIEGKYRIVRLIGEGGMGAVYEGENLRIKRRVAIKVLHAATAANAEAVQRFEREAQAAGRIGSDHILEVLDLGILPNNDRFMVMEYLDGEPLSARILRKGKLSPVELAPLAKQVLAGLSAAHSTGIIHRDLKPDNIYILREKAGQPDYVKIIDFGISKFQSMPGDVMNMTRTGAVMGTPYYMSPEQANGSREADARSDLYSIGVILYECLTGQVPFDAKSFNELLFKIVLSTPPSPLALVPDLDPAFCSIVSKGMARDVEHRFQTAEQFAAAIENWSRTGAGVTLPPEHRPPGVPAGAVPGAQAMPHAGVNGPNVAAQPAGVPKQSSQSWATSHHEDPVSLPKSKSNGVAIAAVAAVLVLGGGAFAAFRVMGGPKADKAPASAVLAPAATSAQPATPTASPTEIPTPAAPSLPAPSGTQEAKPAEAKPPVVDDAKPANAKPADVQAAGKPVKPAKPFAPKPAGGSKPSGKPAAPDFGY